MLNKLIIICALLFYALPSSAQFLHMSVQSKARALPKKFIILPAEIAVHEMSMRGHLTYAPEWTKQASDNLRNAIVAFANRSDGLAVVDLPALSAAERQAIAQTTANFMTVGPTAYHVVRLGGQAWAHKQAEFDYTLGTGLAFLKNKTGADAAIVFIADDVVSSDARKLTGLFTSAFFAAPAQSGFSVVLAAVVDLGSGDLLWLHHDDSAIRDLKDPDTAQAMIAKIFRGYPGTR